jgi:hypothetical protein
MPAGDMLVNHNCVASTLDLSKFYHKLAHCVKKYMDRLISFLKKIIVG